MIKGANHVGLSVVNLDRSIQFYRELLGMEFVVGETPIGGELYEKIFSLSAVRGRACILSKGSLRLELFEFFHPVPKTKDSNYPVTDHGISHFCMEVTNIGGMYERLKNAGVVFHCPPLDFGASKATYARDPDGNVFELLELSTSEKRGT